MLSNAYMHTCTQCLEQLVSLIQMKQLCLLELSLACIAISRFAKLSLTSAASHPGSAISTIVTKTCLSTVHDIHNMIMIVMINIRIPHPHPNTQHTDKPHHPTTPPTIAKGEFHFFVKPQPLGTTDPHRHQIPYQELPHPNLIASTH